MTDWPPIILASATLVTSIAALVTSMRNTNKTVELTKQMDGHMSTLIEQTKVISKAEGKVEGNAEGIIKGSELKQSDRRGSQLG